MIDSSVAFLLITAFLIAFFAVAAHSVTGFGFGLIFVPTLSLVADPKLAVLLSFVFGGGAAAYIAIQSRRDIVSDVLWPLTAAGIVGIAIGMYLLFALPAPLIKLAMGIFVLGIGLPMALGRTFRVPKTRSAAFVAGLLGGFINGTVGMGGPPVIMYLINRGFDKDAMRTTLSAYYTLSSIFFLGVAATTQRFDGSDLPIVLAMVPAIPVGIWLGNRGFSRLGSARFRQVILVVVFVSGVVGLYGGLSSLLAPQL